MAFGCCYGGAYAGSSRFARRYYGNLFDFFSCGYLDVSVRRVRVLALYIQARTGSPRAQVSPLGHPRFQAPIGTPVFSCIGTSFVAHNRQGIHCAHLSP